jgi:hypothetical protein
MKKSELIQLIKEEIQGYSPQIGKTKGFTPDALDKILKKIASGEDYEPEQEIDEEKADRCLRIARREIPQSSAYRSGLIVKCRKGMIWKNKK